MPNGDESPPFLGSFHKTLPHDARGVVDAGAYATLMLAAADRRPGPAAPCFEDVPRGSPAAAALLNPQAARARETLGPDPFDIEMWPAPRLASDSTAAEMTELFWMALLRDVPLAVLHGQDAAPCPAAEEAVAELDVVFRRALASDGAGQGEDAARHLRPGLGLGLDLPCGPDGALLLDRATLFRGGFPDERHGPPVSQFLLHDVPFGAQTIRQAQLPYAPHRDYLQNLADWRHAQDTGRDRHGRACARANSRPDDPAALEPAPRRIGTLRDLARFAHGDALHQACGNAALLLLDWDAPPAAGNPHAAARPGRLRRQAGFATLGAPNLLAMVGAVAAPALKAVWRQKWLVHRRLRPEAYGGLMTMQAFRAMPCGLPEWVLATGAAGAVRALNRAANARTPFAAEDNLLLPVAYTSGAPAHPAYGSGHAAVAGAGVTVLKAWFEEDQPIRPLIESARHPEHHGRLRVLQADRADGGPLPHAGADLDRMTIGGELNKLAANVALGRCMAGVNWRSDAMRGLRLGEAVATAVLARQVADYAEADVTLAYRSFDGHRVTIAPDGVAVPGDPALQDYYRDLLRRALP
jgi:hypothetical protein